jgi:hypothetical protein
LTSNIHNNLKDFNPISLAEMDEISLLRRYDQKFTLNTSQFQVVFPLLASTIGYGANVIDCEPTLKDIPRQLVGNIVCG